MRRRRLEWLAASGRPLTAVTRLRERPTWARSRRPLRRSETIGGSDTTDVFRFTLSAARPVHVELRGLSADIDLYVFDAHFQLLGRNYQGGTLAEQLDLDLTPGRSIMLLIIPHGDVRSAYELIIDPQAVPSPPIRRLRPRPNVDHSNPVCPMSRTMDRDANGI